MDTAGLDVLNFHYAVVGDGVLESEVNLLRVRIAVGGIHDASSRTGSQIGACRWDHWCRIDAVTIVAKENASAGDELAWASSIGAVGVDGVGVGKDLAVRLLDHEQRDIFEGLAEVETVTAAENEAAIAECVEGETDAGAEVEVGVFGKAGVVASEVTEAGGVAHAGRGQCLGGGDSCNAGFRGGNDLLVGAAIGLVVDAIGADLAIVTKAEVEEQTRSRTPVVFEVEAEHGWRKVEGGITRRSGRGLDGAGGGEAGGEERFVAQHGGCCRKEVELGSGVVLEEAADLRLVDEIDTRVQGVSGKRLGEVVAELEVVLAGFL